MNTAQKRVINTDFCLICWNNYRCEQHNQKTITVTSFDFKTGEYTTRTERVELN